nr:MAG TPA: Protein of unknown function (DUF983) [Caudoviricetes sp.]
MRFCAIYTVFLWAKVAYFGFLDKENCNRCNYIFLAEKGYLLLQ